MCMCILHIVFCTVCKYVLSICKLFLFFALFGARSQEFHSPRHLCCGDVTIKVIWFDLIWFDQKKTNPPQNMRTTKVIHDYYKSRTTNRRVKPIGFLDWPWFWRAIVAHPPLSVFNKAPHWNPPSPHSPPPIFNSALSSERSLGASLHSQTMAPKQTWVSGMLHINYIMAQSDDSRP